MPDKAFTPHPAYFKAAFSLAFAGRLYIRRWQSTPRKTASNGRRSRKMPSAPARNQMLRRGGFHQRWQGVSHHDFNHFKTNSSQKCCKSGLFCADGGAATARRSRRKADSWRRWKSPPINRHVGFSHSMLFRCRALIIVCWPNRQPGDIDSVTISAINKPISEIKSRRYFTQNFS